MKDLTAPPFAATLEFGLAAFEAIDVPDRVLSWPSMMTKDEISLIYRLAAAYWSGQGLIVDAGIFLGASTQAFAEGVECGGRATDAFVPVRSYDLAVWVASMDGYLDRPDVTDAIGCNSLSDGASYADALSRLLEPFANKVELTIGNIIETARTELPVEIAFYDCLKAAERDLAVFNAFAPHYIPGRTVILQQDYFYESAAEHKIRQELYARHYTFLGQVGSTAVFRLDSALPLEAFRRDPLPDLPVVDRITLLEQAASRANNTKGRILVRLSLFEHLMDIGAIDAAREMQDDLGECIGRADKHVVTRRPENVFAGLARRLERL